MKDCCKEQIFDMEKYDNDTCLNIHTWMPETFLRRELLLSLVDMVLLRCAAKHKE